MSGLELSKEKLAQVFDVDTRTVDKWLRQGCPGKKTDGKRWSFNTAEVSGWLRTREREAALEQYGVTDPKDAERRKQAADAGIAEHKEAVLKGLVVPIADFEAKLGGAIGAARAKLLNLGSKLGPMMPQCGSAAEAKAVIDEAVYEILNELSDFDPEIQTDTVSDGEFQESGEEDAEVVGAAAETDRQ